MGSALLALRPPKLFSAREAYELALQRRPGDKFFSKQLAKVVERQSSEAWCSPDAGGRARSCFIENAAHMQAIFALLGVRLRLRLRLRLRGALPPSSPPIRYSISCESFSRCHSLLLTYVCAAHPSIDRLNAPFSPLLCRSPPPCPPPPPPVSHARRPRSHSRSMFASRHLGSSGTPPPAASACSSSNRSCASFRRAPPR